MIDWKIDCPTFLRLTDTSIGEHGVYRIEIDGVYDWRTKERINSVPIKLTTEESAVMLESIENAKLSLPTTATQLLEWVGRQGGDFAVPDWFTRSAQAQTRSDAEAIMDAAEVDLHSQREADAKGPSSTAAERHTIKWLQSEAEAELRAMQSLRAAIPVEFERASKQTRSDAMAVEIKRAREDAGANASPAEIMLRLQSYAGKLGSCITAKAANGVLWTRGRGGAPDKLTIDALEQRLARDQKRGAGIAKGSREGQ